MTHFIKKPINILHYFGWSSQKIGRNKWRQRQVVGGLGVFPHLWGGSCYHSGCRTEIEQVSKFLLNKSHRSDCNFVLHKITNSNFENYDIELKKYFAKENANNVFNYKIKLLTIVYILQTDCLQCFQFQTEIAYKFFL